MNRRSLLLVLLFAVVLAGQTATVAGTERTVYFEETFDNESVGTVLYQTDFESGTDGWNGWLYVYYGSELDQHHRQVDSRIETTGYATVDSSWNRYHIRQRRDITVEEGGTYDIYVRAGAGFPEGSHDDHVNYDRLEVDGRELSLEDGVETHHRVDLSPGDISFKREAQYQDSDGGHANASATLDRIAVIQNTRQRFGIWESNGFPLYTDRGIDGTSLFAQSVTASVNASPAQHRDPVVLEFALETGSENATWTIRQSGHRIAEGAVEADRQRRVRRTMSLQSGEFELDIDSRDTVAIDDLRVVGYRSSTSGADVQPSVPVLERAAPKEGYQTLLGSLSGILDLGLDTATYLALVGIAAGGVLFVAGTRRSDRGTVLVVGSVALLIGVIVFVPILDTVAWIFTGGTDQPALEDPDLAATTMLFQDEFESGSLRASDWRQVAGPPSKAYLDDSTAGPSQLVLREDAVVETTVPLDRAGIDSGVLSVASRVESNVNQAPPDEDALSLSVESGGSTLVDDSTAIVATGGDPTERTVRRQVTLSGSKLTIRLGVRDTNGGDERARADVYRVELRGGL